MLHHRIFFAAILIAAAPLRGEPESVLDMENPPPDGQTLVWSPLFQAGWDKMNSLRAGKPGKVEPPNPLIEGLNRFQWDRDVVMPKDNWAVFAGPANREFAEATAAEIKRQFRVDMTPSRLPDADHGNAVYAILMRNLQFEKRFFRSRKMPLFFKDSIGKTHMTAFFGTTGALSDRYGDSVKVLAYRDNGKSFILSIATNKTGWERVILYKPVERMSFKTAINHVNAAVKSPLDGDYGSLKDGTLHRNDTVNIPYLAFDADTDFTDRLEGLISYTGETLPWIIKGAYQIVRFKLSEKGAQLRVEAAIEIEPFGPADPAPSSSPPLLTPRNFICNDPFFVFAWKGKAKLPYFAAWIDGNDALEPFKQPK